MCLPFSSLSRRPSVAFTDFEIKDKRSSFLSSLLLLSAIGEGVASFVLPIIDAFGPPKYVEHKFYFEIFQLIQFTVSIAALAYLQALMTYYNRKMQRRERLRQRLAQGFGDSSDNHIEEEEEEDDDEDDDDEDGENGSNESTEAVPTSPPDYASSPIQTEESSGEVFHESSPASAPGIACHDSSQKSNDTIETQSMQRHRQGFLEAKHLAKGRVTNLGRMFGDTFGTISKTNPPYTQDTEGINLYLRLGTVVFGFGVIIMDGFRVADQFRAVSNEKSCHSILWTPLNAIHAIYIFWQTYFLFKYHRVTFNIQKFIIRFILSHMAVVNLGQWLSTVVEEVVSSKEKNLHLTNTMHSLADVVVAKGPLTPDSVFPSHPPPEEPGREQSTSKTALHLRDDPTECHRAHKGLFVGLLLFLATLVALALFYIFQRRHSYQHALMLYQINYIILFAIGIIAASIALYRIRVLGFRELSEEDAFDDNLLLLGLVAVLFYDLFLLIPSVDATAEHRKAGAMFVGKAILEMAQALLQVFLILEASRREAGEVEHTNSKPGRTIITFLLVLNLAMWIVNTFGLKHAENHEIFRLYYTGLAWKIITHLSLPLIIFFRFHSTVCLADIWTNAYRFHYRHTEV
ncbi:unnamed protein product [Taenia asiatica]|uniref:Otopetrin-2 n=1 Tax=Taenia asiatica TaxID=60517 RepID=A0A158RAG8_TAEAS|nr:unnamed protein product [Taenia asiatica]